MLFCTAFATRLRKKKHNLDPNYLQGDSLVVGYSTLLVCLTGTAGLPLIDFSLEDLNIFFQTKRPPWARFSSQNSLEPFFFFFFFLLWPHTELGMKQVQPQYTHTQSGDEAGREMVP